MAGPYYLKSGNAVEWSSGMSASTGSPGTLVVPKRSGTGTATMKHYVYECTASTGVASTTEPTWPTTAGTPVTDGGITWTCRDCTSWTYANIYLDFVLGAVTAAGDTIYVSYLHNEVGPSGTTISYVFAGTSTNPNIILSSDHTTGAPPTALRAGAAFTTTNAAMQIGAGGAYIYGSTFTCASSATTSIAFNISNTNAANYIVFDSCALAHASTGSSTWTFGSSGSFPNVIRLINTTLQVGNASTPVSIRGCALEWFDTPSAIQGATLPTNLFTVTAGTNGSLLCRGVDLSALGSGKTLFQINTSSMVAYPYARFERCKLGSSVTKVSNGTSAYALMHVEFVNCTTGTALTAYDAYISGGYVATITTDTANHKATGGGSVTSDGLNPYSYKVTTGAGSKNWLAPGYSPWLTTYVETTGSKTVSVDIMYDSTSGTLTANDVWLEIDYCANASDICSTTAVTRADASNLTSYLTYLTTGTSGSALPSGASWTTSGITSVATSTLSKTITLGQKGFVRARVCFGKTSRTVYVDPNIAVT